MKDMLIAMVLIVAVTAPPSIVALQLRVADLERQVNHLREAIGTDYQDQRVTDTVQTIVEFNRRLDKCCGEVEDERP